MIRLPIYTVLIGSLAVGFCKSGGNLAVPVVGSAVLGILSTALSERRSAGRNFIDAFALGLVTGATATLAYWKAVQGRWFFDDGEEMLWLVVLASFSAAGALAGSTITLRFRTL